MVFLESKDNFHWLEITKVSGDANISKVTVITDSLLHNLKDLTVSRIT